MYYNYLRRKNFMENGFNMLRSELIDSDTIRLLFELLAIDSVSPNDAGCQELLIERLAPVGFDCERMNFNHTSNLWAKIGEGKPLVCFAGHTDVVPAGNLAAWHSPPFEPVVRDGYLYARGAADMKSGLAAFITAIERFVRQYPDFKGSIAVLITSDEESDGLDGTTKVVEVLKSRGERIQYAVVAEPTSIHVLGDTIKNGRRGTMSGKLVIKGKQGHIAYPHLAINPIHRALPALNELIAHEWDGDTAHFSKTSLQLSNVHAGLGVSNVIPPDAQIWFNFRFSPESTAEGLQQKVEEILTRHGLDYDLDWQVSGLPFVTPEGYLTEVCQGVIADELNVKADINTLGGTSDGRFIKDISDELIEFGPVNATIHQLNECVSVQDVVALSKIYEKMLAKLLLN